MRNNEKVHLTDLDLALCRSAFYEAFSLSFSPPEHETVERLLLKEQNQSLSEIAAMLDEVRGEKKFDSLSSLVRKLRTSSDVQDVSLLKNLYQYLFGHTAYPKVPPYETEYGEETLFQQPQQLGDIAGFYTAFGLKLNLNEHERVDHISCESEFLAFLTRKEAFALEHNDQSMLQETRKAQKLFLKDHLGRFAPSFSKSLIRENPNGFYGSLGKLCNEFILMECTYHGVTPGPEQLRLQPSVLVDECLTCGSGEGVN